MDRTVRCCRLLALLMLATLLWASPDSLGSARAAALAGSAARDVPAYTGG